MLDQLAEEVAGTAKVGKVNVDENPRLTAAYQIEAVPTILVFKNGQVVERFAGVQSKRRLVEAIERSP
jgi:thioredoxin 1